MLHQAPWFCNQQVWLPSPQMDVRPSWKVASLVGHLGESLERGTYLEVTTQVHTSRLTKHFQLANLARNTQVGK